MQAVYGAGGGWEAFDWHALQVLFPQFLTINGIRDRTAIVDCLNGHASVYKKSFMHARWVNFRSQASLGLIPHTAHINRGGVNNGTRPLCREATWGWVEVMHRPKLTWSRVYQASWSNQLWMYAANGSGHVLEAIKPATLQTHSPVRSIWVHSSVLLR